MKIGDYVRTINGKIWIIKSQQAISGHKKDIIKYSDKLIDLIEVGDYVNGSLVLSIYIEPYGTKEKVLRIERTICKGSAFGDENETVYNNQIETIVTHEQFESMEYRIGDKKNIDCYMTTKGLICNYGKLGE